MSSPLALLYVNPAAATPIYQQLVEQITRLVRGGQLPQGAALPSVREVAAAHAINPMTVSKAYAQLEGQGLLERHRGKGMTVARVGTSPLADRLALLEPALATVRQQARELELPLAAVAAQLLNPPDTTP